MTLASSVVTIICHFLTLMVLIRVLDEYAMGVYFAAFITLALLVLVCDFGIDMAFLKLYPEYAEEDRKRLIGAAVVLRLAACALFSILFLTAVSVSDAGVLEYLSNLALLILIFFLQQSVRSLFLRILQAEKMFTHFALIPVTAAFLKLAFVASLLLFEDVGVHHVLLIENATFAVSLAYALIILRKKLAEATTTSSREIRALFMFGWPLYLNALLNLGNQRVSNYIVAALGGPIALAFFSVAERLSDAGARVYSSFTNVYLPIQTSLFAKPDVEGAKALASRSLLWTTAVIGFGVVAFAIIREPITVLLFTERYASVADPTVMFLIVLLFRALQVLLGYFGVAAGLNFLPIRVSLISSVFNIAYVLILFNWYGYAGAIAALIATQALMAVLYALWLRKAGFGVDIRATLGLLAICAGALAWVYAMDGSILLGALALPAIVLLAQALLPAFRADLSLAVAKAREMAQRRARVSG